MFAGSNHRNREVVQVGLGDDGSSSSSSSSCGICAHLFNLQGLAITSASSLAVTDGVATTSDLLDPLPTLPLFRPQVTHSIFQNLYVPRALLVTTTTTTHFDKNYVEDNSSFPSGIDKNVVAAATNQFPTWGGAVETVNLGYQEEQDPRCHRSTDASWNQFQRSVSFLTNAPYSRYRVPINTSVASRKEHYASSSMQTIPDNKYQSTGRHVNWDEEKDEEDDDEHDRTKPPQEHPYDLWKRTTLRETQDSLEEYWSAYRNDDAIPEHSSVRTEGTDPIISNSTNDATTVPRHHQNRQNSWKNYFMPPFHPQTILRRDGSGSRWCHGGSEDEYDEMIRDRLRQILEECNAVEGIMIVSSNSHHPKFSTIVQEFNDQCPHANSISVLVDNEQDYIDYESLPSNQKQHRMVRKYIQNALALSEATELTDLVLPLELSNNDWSAASAAMALEAVTMPFRLSGFAGSRSQIGMQSYYAGSYSGSHPYGTVPFLSLREFVHTLRRQSSPRNVIELDALLPPDTISKDQIHVDGKNIMKILRKGTSVERDIRMRQRDEDRSGQEGQLPGDWLGRSSILSCLSRRGDGSTSDDESDRSLHRHFALSAAIRPSMNVIESNDNALLTCLMESVGIRYRPEQSMATVVDQSLAELTTDGYGAGSYWKSLFANLSSLTVLATLGNTTRCYRDLYHRAHNATEILDPRNKKSFSRAMYNRDVVDGILPEVDDCQDAISACLDLSDSYEPPVGSGLIMDE